jgi:DNA repair protein RadC
VFREAARAGAAALVLFHNHPSGDPRPSPDDVALTRRLVVVGELMGISVLDHIVLADRQFYTMQGAGELDAHKLPRGDWRMLLP